MSGAASMIALGDIALDRASKRPVYMQLSQQIRSLIVGGRLAQGLRLPSSRDLADDLGLARKTVVTAFDQLIAEGYLSAQQGAGTFVEDISFSDAPKAERLGSTAQQNQKLASFGEFLPLSPDTPDMKHFPRTAWARAAVKGQRSVQLGAMFAPGNGGYQPLRQALAEHLWTMRGVRCDPEQILVTSGLRESFTLVCAALLAEASHVAVEDPGYQAFPQLLDQFSLQAIHTPVDANGMKIGSILTNQSTPDAVCVSASRQYPTGAPLSLKRRAELVSWAARTGGWLVEDDYDCEFRFDGPPLQSMFSMDSGKRTLYFGSLSKTLFPRLRLSFLVAPIHIAADLIAEQNQRSALASLPAQAALAEFITNGQFAAHIRRMRRVYARRYEQTYRLCEQELGEWLSLRPCSGGFSFAAHFRPDLASKLIDTDFVRAAREDGIGVQALSSLSSLRSTAQRGLLVGFAGTDRDQSSLAVQKLRTQFQQIPIK